MGLSTTALFWDFYETQAELLVSSLVRVGRGRNGVIGWKWRGEEGWEEMRGQSGRGSRLTDMEMKSRGETEIPTFPWLPLCIYPSKREGVRPNKTFIIPGKLFNVPDIKTLKGGSERWKEGKREEGREDAVRGRPDIRRKGVREEGEEVRAGVKRGKLNRIHRWGADLTKNWLEAETWSDGIKPSL